MREDHLDPWRHEHEFGQSLKRPGESRTVIVIGITATMMAIEIIAGVMFGSMALLADGLHMASHAVALGINAFAYIYARKHARDARYSFGTGKVNALGGYTGAVLLALFALLMGYESVKRLILPEVIAFNPAIMVAIIGLAVNGASMLILRENDHHHSHDEGRDHDHGHHHHDHNLRSAYLHVLADAVTSLLAIFALLAAKFFGLIWMDALMGIVGGALVLRWSLHLLRSSGGVLLDRQGPEGLQSRIKECVESDGESRVADLHLWSLGPSIYGVILAVVSPAGRQPAEYKRRLAADARLVHVTVEVCGAGSCGPRQD